MLVKDFMIKDVFVLEENESLKSLLELMVDKRVGGVPVINKEKKLVGMISDGDVLRGINPKTYAGYYIYYIENLDENIIAKADQPIKHLMRKKVVTVHENNDLEDVLKLLAHHHFKKIPVINDHKEIVGIVSRGDMIRKLRERLLATINNEQEK